MSHSYWEKKFSNQKSIVTSVSSLLLFQNILKGNLFLYFLDFLFYNGVLLINNAVLASDVQPSDSGIHRHLSILQILGTDMYTLLYSKWKTCTSLVVQWLRLCLPMQAGQV